MPGNRDMISARFSYLAKSEDGKQVIEAIIQPLDPSDKRFIRMRFGLDNGGKPRSLLELNTIFDKENSTNTSICEMVKVEKEILLRVRPNFLRFPKFDRRRESRNP